MVWSFVYFFTLLSGYYVLRPVRDEMGITGGIEKLPWMFTGTFAATLVAVAVYSAVVARAPRRAKDGGAAWRDWRDRQVVPAFEGRIIPVDAAVIRRRAQIAYADDREGLRPATALVHNLTLVTGEARKYRTGRVKLLDPAGFEFDDADWRGATRTGAAWLRNLLIR